MPYSNKIIDILRAEDEQTVASLVKKTGKSRQFIHRQLNDLMARGNVVKLGVSPRTYYRYQPKIVSEPEALYLSKKEHDFLEEHFLIVTEIGKKLSGIDAITHWCSRQQLPLKKTISEYIFTRTKYLSYFNNHQLIDGTKKIKDTKGFDEIYLDKMYYLDFYAIERFGKTRLGTLMHYAKQGQNKKLMEQIVSEIRNRVKSAAKMLKANAVLFVPPTIKRNVQIMHYLEEHLQLKLPKVKITKVNGEIVVPQKALSKIHERIANAQHTFIIPEQKKFKRILLIDDAVGSGATLNEIAHKLKRKNLVQETIGLAITGSFKGFDVIHEI